MDAELKAAKSGSDGGTLMARRGQVNRKHLAGLVVVVIAMAGAVAILPRHIAALGAANETVVQQQLNTKGIDQIVGRSGELKADDHGDRGFGCERDSAGHIC